MGYLGGMAPPIFGTWPKVSDSVGAEVVYLLYHWLPRGFPHALQFGPTWSACGSGPKVFCLGVMTPGSLDIPGGEPKFIC